MSDGEEMAQVEEHVEPGTAWALFTAVLPDCRAYGKHSVAVLNPEDQVFVELTVCPRFWRKHKGCIEEHRLFRQILLPRIHRFAGRAAMLAVAGGDTYYHWMMEVLPRLELIRRSGIGLDSVDYFLVNGRRRPFQEATLRHLGIFERCVGLDEHPHIKAGSIIAPSFASVSGRPPRWALNFLRKSFGGLADGVKKPTERRPRIYISRANNRGRWIENENEIRDLAEKSGFHTVYLEHMELASQVELFAQVEVVVGLHGAGFSNLVFARPGTKVLEIFAPDFVPDMYQHMARRLEFDHNGITARAGSLNKRGDRVRQVVVNPEEFGSMLKKVIS